MKWTGDRIDEFVRLNDLDLPFSVIAEKLGTTLRSLRWARERYNLPTRNVRWTPKMVERLRADRAAGKTYKQISNETGLSVQSLHGARQHYGVEPRRAVLTWSCPVCGGLVRRQRSAMIRQTGRTCSQVCRKAQTDSKYAPIIAAVFAGKTIKQAAMEGGVTPRALETRLYKKQGMTAGRGRRAMAAAAEGGVAHAGV